MATGEVYYSDDGIASMVLDSKVDPNYEPTQDELEEYAKWLGIDMETEKELMFIAREGLKAPLPEDWKPCKTDTGDVYYFNFASGESIWEHPLDEHFKSRLEEERAKLKAGLKVGPAADDKKGKKDSSKKAATSKKLEKGAAGNVIPETTSTTKAAGAAAVPLPVKGRLGALGSDGGARPDVSDLVPSPSASAIIPKAFALSSGKKETGKDTAEEDDRKLRESLRAEHDAHLAKLAERHEAAEDDRRHEHERALKKVEQELATKHEDEVDDVVRASERRTRRELQMFEESIERQVDDLKRTLNAERNRLDAETSAVDARVEAELATKRKAAAASVDAKVATRQAAIRSEWHREKQDADAKTDRAIADANREMTAKIDAAAQRESRSVAERLSALDDEHQRELRALQAELSRRHHDTIAALQRQSGAADAEQQAAYAKAEAEYAQAVAEAKRRVAGQADAVRADFAARRAAAESKHAAEVARLKESSAAKRQSALAELDQTLRAEAAAREADARTVFTNDVRLKHSQFADETDEMVASARQAALSQLASLQSESADAVQRVTKLHDEQLRAEVDELRRVHQQRLDDIAAAGSDAPDASSVEERVVRALEAKQAAWKLANPPPAPASPTQRTRSAAGSDSPPVSVEGERAKLQAAADRRVRELEAQLERERRAALEAHRARAQRDMEARLAAFEAERRSRAASASLRSPTSPAAVTVVTEERLVAAVELSASSEALLAAERAKLQAKLDSLALEIAAGAGYPPRPSSTPLGPISRDLPNLRGSTTMSASRHTSAQASPMRGSDRHREPHYHHEDALVLAAAAAGSEHRQPADSSSDAYARRLRRLEKAKERVRAEKASIRARQAELEAARDEWRRDMRRAKDDRDKRQQQVLHVAKGVLEERARVLNSDTVALRASLDLIKEEELKLRGGGGGELSADAEGARVYDMLKAIAAKVDHVETMLHRPAAVAAAHNTSGTRGRERGVPDETTAKWQRYMRPSSSGPGRVPTPVGHHPNRHVDVESWLEETA